MTDKAEILSNLGIDTNLMVSDPDTFADQIYSAADSALSILRNTGGESAARKNNQRQADHDTAAANAAVIFADDTFDSEEMWEALSGKSSAELYHLAKLFRKMSDDVKNLMNDKLRTEMIDSMPTYEEREEALFNFEILKETFTAWRKMIKVLEGKEYPPLKRVSVTIIDDSAQTYPVYRYQGEDYTSYRAIARFIGAENIHNHTDLVEWMSTHEITSVEFFMVRK